MVPDWVLTPTTTPIQLHATLSDYSAVSISSATSEDIHHVEVLIRDAAIHGSGFALDEFMDGYFNRKLLLKSHTLAAKTSNGDVIGGAVFGPCALCRSRSSQIIMAHVVIHPHYHGKGVCQILLSTVEEYARETKMLGVFVSCFVTDHPQTLFLMRNGYVCVCSIPKSGFVNGNGVTDCALWYKQFHSSNQSIEDSKL